MPTKKPDLPSALKAAQERVARAQKDLERARSDQEAIAAASAVDELVELHRRYSEDCAELSTTITTLTAEYEGLESRYKAKRDAMEKEALERECELKEKFESVHAKLEADARGWRNDLINERNLLMGEIVSLKEDKIRAEDSLKLMTERVNLQPRGETHAS